METKFNFKSQICTTREQSERLIALGLKKETADMVLVPSSRHDGSDVIRVRKSYLMEEDAIPAWSLHRLIEMMPSKVEFPLSGMPKDFDFEIDPNWGEYFVDLCDTVDYINWLNENHFDYRGLIEKGLAIDATGLNIY